MTGKATKKSGQSPGTGRDKLANARAASRVLEKVEARNSLIGAISVEMPAGKDYIKAVSITPKLFLYMGYDKDNVGTFFDAMENDTNKIFNPQRKGILQDAEGTANQPGKGRRRRGAKRTGGRQVCLVLPEPYPLNEIGGNTGTKGNNSDNPTANRAPAETMTIRVSDEVPLIGVGIFLYHMNLTAPKQDRRILEFCTPTSIRYSDVPVTSAELTQAISELAKVSE